MVNSSCSVVGLYTKQQAIKKFCTTDTITTFVTTHDTIRTETIQADTTFADTNDTVIMERDKMVIRYIHKDRKVYLQGTCKGDTIYLTKTIPVKTAVLLPQPPELTFWQKLKMDIIDGFALLGLTAFIAGILLLIFRKR